MQQADDALLFEIIRAARAVHQALGPGFVESIYNRALAIEFRCRNLIIEREKFIRVTYASCVVGRHYLDLVVENRVIVELKATRAIIPVFDSQMRSYLTATDYPMGLIVNFGATELEWKPVTAQLP